VSPEHHEQLAWAAGDAELLAALAASPGGLPQAQADERLARDGPNALRPRRRATAMRILAAQFRSPLVLILVFAAAVSMITRDWADASIVLAIIAASALLGFSQEYRASRAVEGLLARISPRARVVRDGRALTVPADTVVVGDLVLLSAGNLVPADARVLEADDFFVNQAMLTGENFPAEKRPGVVAAAATAAARTNCVFMGTNVRSGMARVLVTATGDRTLYGAIAARLALRSPETEFERGIRRFGQLLTQLMTLLVLAIFALNVWQNRSVVESLLFAVAIAVGLAPELLPAIISITLARGSRRLATLGVLVRRLAAIENLGSMDVLCTDKTGTLTVGDVSLQQALAPTGQASARVLELAFVNASLQTGLVNPLDEAIVATAATNIERYRKTEEIPYDFVRKRLSIAVRDDEATDLLITKGALDPVLSVCASLRDGERERPIDTEVQASIGALADGWMSRGVRVLGVATRRLARRASYGSADESQMCFEGFLLFVDPPKPDARDAIDELRRLGVALKIITGDSRQVALHTAEAVGLEVEQALTGAQIRDMRDEALWQQAGRTTIFSEVDPNQKERIIVALRRTGHVVGYLGDGINDAPALHAADVGISVDNAVDVARETADIVLLEHSLRLLREGIEEGRRVFANTLKYVYTTSSANFGNMLSMAMVSAVLPFLPLLPKQILLNNFLSDIPAMALAGDRVDPERVERPHRWSVRSIRDFMVVFGLISTAFDALTFALLWFVLRAAPDEFRTAWFVESLLTELMILLVVRTHRPIWASAPSRALWASTLAVAAVAVALPWTPWVAQAFGFVALPAVVLAALAAITLLYTLANEAAKRRFFARATRDAAF
jgi:Mg2+-importing ATPase